MTPPGTLNRRTSLLIAESAALFVISLVSVLHVAWAILLGFSAAAAGSTPVAAVVTVTGSRAVTIAVMAGTGILALAVILRQRDPRHPPARPGILALSLVPQQILLLVSAFGGIAAAVKGHYADGVARPWQFIISDQLPIILVAFLYTAALVVVVWASRPSPVVTPAVDGVAGRAEQQRDQADDQHDDAEGPQDADTGQQSQD